MAPLPAFVQLLEPLFMHNCSPRRNAAILHHDGPGGMLDRVCIPQQPNAKPSYSIITVGIHPSPISIAFHVS